MTEEERTDLEGYLAGYSTRDPIVREKAFIEDWLNSEARLAKLSSTERALAGFMRAVSFSPRLARVLKEELPSQWQRLFERAYEVYRKIEIEKDYSEEYL